MSINLNPTRQGALVNQWYKWFGPAPVAPDASFKQRDAVRRAQTASWILLVVIILVLLPIPEVLDKPFVLIPIFIVAVCDVVALILNKYKQTKAAGIIVIITINFGLLGTLLSVPGGMPVADLPVLDLLIQSVIVAACMLGAGWSFVLMFVNIGIIFGLLHSPAISPELRAAYALNPNVFIQAVEVEAMVAVIVFILVYFSDRAIANLDRSEEIVAMERQELQRQQEELNLKQQLDEGIRQLMDTHTQVANGNYGARAPLAQDNVLWRVAYSLNTLLARLASNANLEQERYQERRAIRQLAENLMRGTTPQRTGTALDEVIVALTTRASNQPPRSVSPVQPARIVPAAPNSEPLQNPIQRQYDDASWRQRSDPRI
ncbi:hypothetical protein ccbrp13_47240 [Ktedonobacteria bacterium brp13]|nr:hypothetical protein ccbrp13_47240 [Ktedonobacteria bacterium brp13]